MKALFHDNFKKKYRRLRTAEQKRFKERRNIFLKNPSDPILNRHPLSGKYQGFFSINITGDLRAIYRPIEHDIAFFITIDTHSNLYG